MMELSGRCPLLAFGALEQWCQVPILWLEVCHFNVITTFRRLPHMQMVNKCMKTHAVVEQRVPVPPLYTIITARRPWPVGNSGRKNSATSHGPTVFI